MWMADSTCTKEGPFMPERIQPAPRSSWSRERKIYLAAGVVVCLVGVLLIAFSL